MRPLSYEGSYCITQSPKTSKALTWRFKEGMDQLGFRVYAKPYLNPKVFNIAAF